MTKTVKPIFLIFSNGSFHLYQYRFEDPNDYSSLKLIKQKNYTIATEINVADIANLLTVIPIVKESAISFPQADRFSRVVNLMELLKEKELTKQQITSKYSFDERQTNYYTDAGRYLEFIEKEHREGSIVFHLTMQGLHVMELGYRERQIALATQILKHKVFNETLRLHLQYGEMPERKKIVQIMKEANLYNVGSESTYDRRASTVIGWVNWILGIIDS